ncbi:SDR family NAD(P)-dependent oxidoreductase [Fictibacillus aquaticus]|uniref:Short-chain dehydrogenase n=1 Tax=Fictibacillus aquaticus TaxID=2021314 RepID=A0A235F6D6_9BACL|nr:SDR family oxidoreductase [Fictibacillus aquaticus]OYD56861.1 short-chain dehydrogenase [Fictibacillus aquaticus]
MNSQTVLITGASSGIGLSFSEMFAQQGYSLVLTARNDARLMEIAEQLQTKYNVHVKTIAQDLSLSQAPALLAAELDAQNITIDILINNAGFAAYGPFTDTKWEEERDMITVNITALTELTKRLLPGMVSRNKGKILNVASTAAFQPGPLMAIYYATKAYVLSFSEALSYELRNTNITVTALAPGATSTNFESRANLGESRLFKSGAMSADEVARAGFNALMQGKRLVIPGAKNKLLASVVRFLPRKTVLKIVHYVQDKA